MEHKICERVRQLLHLKRLDDLDAYVELLIASGDVTLKEMLAEFWPAIRPMEADKGILLELHRAGELKFTS